MQSLSAWSRNGSHGRARSPTVPGSLEAWLDLLLLLPALGHVDLEGLVPLDDRAPPEAQEDHAAANEQARKEAPDCDAGNSAVVQVTSFDVRGRPLPKASILPVVGQMGYRWADAEKAAEAAAETLV